MAKDDKRNKPQLIAVTTLFTIIRVVMLNAPITTAGPVPLFTLWFCVFRWPESWSGKRLFLNVKDQLCGDRTPRQVEELPHDFIPPVLQDLLVGFLLLCRRKESGLESLLGALCGFAHQHL